MALTPRLQTVNPLCLDILYRRGMRTPEEMEAILFPSLVRTVKSSPRMLDTDRAVQVLIQARENGSPVTIYHDYDVDGVTSAAICISCMERLGMKVHSYCNDRAVDGFGICPSGIDTMMSQYPDTKVMVTVDNGITGVAGTEHAKKLGLKVIITDHHEPDGVLPDADAVIDHKRLDEPDTQDRTCCGAGVAWKLMLALYNRLHVSIQPVLDALDFAALGTIADIVPLLGFNRAVVIEGLRLINSRPRPFFRVVREMLDLPVIDTEAIGFKLAPMINAVSRMGKPVGPVVRLLLSSDERILHQGILELQEINRVRKEETARELDLVSAMVPPDFDEPLLMVASPDLQEGIIGIVASQLKEKYHVPAAVFALDRRGNWKGSCRSHDGFHLKNALDQCSEFLLNYGGHAKGAGLTVRAGDFDRFRERFMDLARRAAETYPAREEVAIDLVLDAEDLTESMVRQLSVLEPFGEGFHKPVLGLRTREIVSTRFIGMGERHVKYIDSSGLSVIQWNRGNEARARARPPRKFVGYPSLNVFRGETFVQFIAD